MDSPDIVPFIARWSSSGAAERANYQLFLSELCDLLGVARPDPTKPDDADNAYVFERSVTFHHPDGSTSTGRIDLYKRACYVLEAKQGVEKREQEAALSEFGKAKSFINLLRSLHGHTDQFVPMIEELWGRMKTGGFSTVLREKVRHFNGGLFEHATALPLTDDQFELLIEASRADWRDVEPAIFGTLLERVLNPIERHKLGAHYTPRAYVERLVMPTVVEPLRAEWDAAKAAAVTLDRQGKTKEAAAEVQRFHRRLCEVRVLDPACGSGNFLYVTLEHLKRLEGEVLNALDRLGHEQAALEMAGFTVDPHQLLGLEVNPRAAAIAELVLWIGYLQWHFRTRGRVAPPEPIIKNFHNIENRDAVLAFDRTEPALDEQGQPVTHWDGRTMKKHPVTGEDVPDETAQVPLLNYVNPRPADWPQADFIVGNPPFLGKGEPMRSALGDGYVEALRKAYPDVPNSVDYVLYWWNAAAALTGKKNVRRFGFITRNSITQKFNRRVLQKHCDSDPALVLHFAIPNHPWIDSSDGAQVRIAITVADMSIGIGRLHTVKSEFPIGDGEVGVELSLREGFIQPDLSIGPNLLGMVPLQANCGLACPGVQLSGQGFVLEPQELGKFSAASRHDLIRRYVTGYDLMQKRREQYVLDTSNLDEELLRVRYADVFQHLNDNLRSARSTKAAQTKDSQEYSKRWWLMAKPRSEFRKALKGLDRFVVSSRTSRHRVFQFCTPDYLPETKVLIVALCEAWQLGVLSSRIHVQYATRRGGWHGVGNDPTYNHTECFDPFPFPATTPEIQRRISALAGEIDAHRKRQQAQHPELTLTEMYNVLEKLRADTPLDAEEQLTHEHGLVSVLRQLHDDLDVAVTEAYSLPPTASDEAILAHLCALNAQRAAEERTGTIRHLRPAFQNPTATATQTTFATSEGEPVPAVAKPAAKLTWPKSLAEQAQAVRSALAAPTDAATLAKIFRGAKADRVEDILETLASLGRARALPGGMYVAV